MRRVAFAVAAGCALACARTPRELTEARAEAALAQARVRQGDLALNCTPEDAEVEVDGVPWGDCRDFSGEPELLRVGEGLHHIRVKKAGYWPYETWYQPSGARAVLQVALSPQQRTE